jgi:hypothetical protein
MLKQLPIAAKWLASRSSQQISHHSVAGGVGKGIVEATHVDIHEQIVAAVLPTP